MSAASLNSMYEQAVAAMDSGDFATAIRKLMAIKLYLIKTPNLANSIGSGGTSSMTFNATSVGEIDNLISECRRQERTAGGSGGAFQQSKITYARSRD